VVVFAHAGLHAAQVVGLSAVVLIPLIAVAVAAVVAARRGES
jgi:hypothetical protein